MRLRFRIHSRMRAVSSAALMVLALLLAPAAHAGLVAGSTIVNTAQVTYDLADESQSAPSNTTSDRINEVLDLTLTRKVAGPVAIPPADPDTFAIPLVLTNTGNGREAFVLGVTAPGQAAAPTVATDVDGNGAYDAAVDITLPPGTATPVLAPGASLNLLLRPADGTVQPGTMTVIADAVTGHGAPGTTFPGQGDGGGDAVVGRTEAEAALGIALEFDTGASAAARLDKSQTVRAPDGSASPVRGAVITYTLRLTTSAVEPLGETQIVDPIPAGTAFVPGSIRIEDVAASDVSDADAAFFDGQAIRIALGEISQPTTRIVTFQVTIL